MIDWAGIMKTVPYSDDDLVSVVLYVGFVIAIQLKLVYHKLLEKEVDIIIIAI